MPNVIEPAVIEKIHRLKAEGLSQRLIVQALEREGIKVSKTGVQKALQRQVAVVAKTTTTLIEEFLGPRQTALAKEWDNRWCAADAEDAALQLSKIAQERGLPPLPNPYSLEQDYIRAGLFDAEGERAAEMELQYNEMRAKAAVMAFLNVRLKEVREEARVQHEEEMRLLRESEPPRPPAPLSFPTPAGFFAKGEWQVVFPVLSTHSLFEDARRSPQAFAGIFAMVLHWAKEELLFRLEDEDFLIAARAQAKRWERDFPEWDEAARAFVEFQEKVTQFEAESDAEGHPEELSDA